MTQSLLTEKQYQDLTKRVIYAAEKRYRIIPLNSLKHAQYRLKRPVYIMLEFEKDMVIASFDDIEAFSYADTESEAINQLCEEIVELYEDLTEDKGKLGVLPLAWLRYLEEIIECK